MQALQDVFHRKKSQGAPALVTFITAGYPEKEDTIPLMLGMQTGGADIIELGIPFSDPMADGPVIQESNMIAVENGMDLTAVLGQLREARTKGLTVPVVLMGYYNPIMAYGEDKAIRDSSEAGANGFIVVDLPPDEASVFRKKCLRVHLSFIPLIAPSTSIDCIRFLSSIADTFVYVVSKMGTTGSSDKVRMNASLPDIIARVRQYVSVPIAVGFGVSNRGHIDYVVESGADGVVIGSRVISIVKKAPTSQRARRVEEYLSQILPGVANGDLPLLSKRCQLDLSGDRGPPPEVQGTQLPAWFGKFGGQYVPGPIADCLAELEAVHKSAMADPEFWKEFRSHYGYMNRPSELYLAENLGKHAGGAKIWLKREDLNHTGSYKINNVMGQILLARRLGKTRIIAETSAGHHGIATAAVCAKFGLGCIIYMGTKDVYRQASNVSRMKLLGAKVIPVDTGSCTLKDAISEAFRDWLANTASTYYLIGSAIGPHPFPTIVRDFQKVISQEIKEQLQVRRGKLPEAVVACVGGGSNAIGTFYNFIEDKNVRLIGVEAGGEGTDGDRHSATLSKGQPGVLHGARTYIMQSPAGQIVKTHSISAGLNYPGVGPEHAWLKDSGRAEYTVATDEEALRGFQMLTQLEGIIPAIETSHAIWAAVQLAKTLPNDADIVVCLSGRGDVIEYIP